MASPSGQLSKARPAVWDAGTSTLGDPRGLLQRRVALFFLLQFVLSSASLLLRLAHRVVEHDAGVALHPLADPKQFIGHGFFTLLFGGVWIFCRRGDRSTAVLHAVEAAGTVLVCGSCAIPFLDPCTGPNMLKGSPLGWQMFLIVVVVLVARAALVPSSATRSLIIGFASVIPVSIGTHGAINSAKGLSFGAVPSETAWMVLVWGVSFVLVTAVTSRTIYGLQARIRAVTRLGQYTLDEKLGEGGMGAVYRARHVMMRRPTAVKLLLPDKAGEENLARFEREVRLTATLTHPNTITIFDYGRTADGVFYYAMELLEGATLEDIVGYSGALPPARVARVLRMVAAALTEAHEKGLIHRDIKPTNIILCEQGGELDIAKVLDFGLVKTLQEPADAGLTREGSIWGTPQYIAPEALTAPDEMDGRGDLYAVGAVGYDMLTAQHVFDGATAVEVCSHHLHSIPPPPSERTRSPLPADLEAVIMDCLEKDPTRRPQSARELETRLEACRDVGEWDSQHARAWWDEHGATLRRGLETTDPTAFADTIAVDLARGRG